VISGKLGFSAIDNLDSAASATLCSATLGASTTIPQPSRRDAFVSGLFNNG